MSQNIKERLDQKLAAKQAEIEANTVIVPVRETDPELEAAQEKVKAGVYAVAARTRSGALRVTMPPAAAPASTK